MNAIPPASQFETTPKELVKYINELRNSLAVTSALLEGRDLESGGTETSRHAVNDAKRLLKEMPRCLAQV